MDRIKNRYLLLLLLIIGYGRAEAHSLPDCKAQLVVNDQQVVITFRASQEIFELASGIKIDLTSRESMEQVKRYLLQHLAVSDSLHSSWTISVGTISTGGAIDPTIGRYPEIISEIILQPSNPSSLQNFLLHCDLVIHQIPNQSILFSVNQDSHDAITPATSQQIGVIAIDVPTGKIFPLKIQWQPDSYAAGFKNMVLLGMQHIREGTDHLLFLLALLLAAPLLAKGKKWGNFGGVRYSIIRLAKMVTAFTLGHSLTLLIGALGWLRLPGQPVEVLIAFSILVSAVHAIRPVFPGRETVVAVVFGLIHGLAFADTLSNLHLNGMQMAMSIAGFNLGIEFMQLLVMMVVVPWLILLSRTSVYPWVRWGGGVMAGAAALGWMTERISGKANLLSKGMESVLAYSIWIIGALALMALLHFFWTRVRTNPGN